MQKRTVNEIRELFLKFFEEKGHLRLKSFSLIPHNDNSLLIINSGMAPLKPYFTGKEIPPCKRVTTCQKCIRTGDIDNIGHTARHGTFFEMLGNFSFGDYFKKDAIIWSWEFLTKVVGLDENRLYPSVYLDDDEAFKLWNEEIGIPKNKIFKFGKEDNFWEHGAGPCGPCSEIYYDRGEKYGCGKPNCTVGCDCDRYMEIWNNVFTQFDNDGHNNYIELKQKNIDTGMGLERLAVAIQDVDSIFEVDTNKALLDKISTLSKCQYKEDKIKDISLRIICDHIKSCTFMISDGIMPSNESRGYVLRRLLRRAIRHGRILNINHSFMKELSEVVIYLCKDGYPELKEKEDFITKIIDIEEENFNKTIDQGLILLQEKINNTIDSKIDSLTFDAKEAFKLYDTYGFPFDLTKEIVEENGLSISIEDYNILMNEQKEKARKARKSTNYMGCDSLIYDKIPIDVVSEFVGYYDLSCKSNILALCTRDDVVDELSEGMEGTLFLQKTSFYPTMGGEKCDRGIIQDGINEFEVMDVSKVSNNKIAHFGKVIRGSFSKSEEVYTKVDANIRNLTKRNHTATHLLQAALREVLGTHIEQAGSYVDDERLRFDFTHFKPLTCDEILKVENIVNNKINEQIDVQIKQMNIDDAKKEGAIALFGEKYDSEVRTIKIDNFSFELCGGCHVDNTREIQCFKIISENGLAQGIRRIECYTSKGLLDYLNKSNEQLKEVSIKLKTQEDNIISKIDSIFDEIKELKNENEKIKNKLAFYNTKNITFDDINGIKVCIKEFNDFSIDELKRIADDIKEKNDNSFIYIYTILENKINIIISMSDFCIKKGLNANNIIKEVCKIIGGGGGGRPNFAEGTGKDKNSIPIAITKIREIINAI
ncbi:MAG: alanine--tRNA ligase [Eubacteriales bacterium]|nr:alanine--tRNA ligase [Eubacteriales bacterium]